MAKPILIVRIPQRKAEATFPSKELLEAAINGLREKVPDYNVVCSCIDDITFEILNPDIP